MSQDSLTIPLRPLGIAQESYLRLLGGRLRAVAGHTQDLQIAHLREATLKHGDDVIDDPCLRGLKIEGYLAMLTRTMGTVKDDQSEALTVEGSGPIVLIGVLPDTVQTITPHP